MQALPAVSIHAPARGATAMDLPAAPAKARFQSTRPHGARRHRSSCVSPPSEVSIHAPARGATLDQPHKIACKLFQSTRPHGARPGANDRLHPAQGCFNPRARTGRDLPLLLEERCEEVSIHAPARGATRAAHTSSGTSIRFNPRARTGRDINASQYPVRVYMFQSTRPHGARRRSWAARRSRSMFQSTRPHGARRQALALPPRRARFNPRARTGRDQAIGRDSQGPGVSIHAPARGATSSASA